MASDTTFSVVQPINHAADSVYPFNLDLAAGTSFSKHLSLNARSKSSIVKLNAISFEDSEKISVAIYAELHDNVKNVTLSENALALRCRIFKSVFGNEVEGLKSGRNARTALHNVDDSEDIIAAGSEDEEINLREESNIPNFVKTAPKKPAIKKKVGTPCPKSVLGLLRTTPAPKHENGVHKARRTTGRGQLQKRAYKWKDPQNKNKRKLYSERAVEVGLTIEAYLAANNLSEEGSATSAFDRNSIEEDLFDEDKNMESESFTGNETDDDDKTNPKMNINEDHQDQLFVQQFLNSSSRVMTNRRVGMPANRHYDSLWKTINSESIDDVAIAIKSALRKIKAGLASQLTPIEEVELHLAVERCELMI